MKLRDINFPSVCNAAGAQGFFGEGYFYHRLWKLFGLTFKDCGFVAKTTTLTDQEGYMRLNADFAPKEWMPKCIIVKFRQGVMLNSAGLSGPGAKALLNDGRWQRRRHQPFFLSFMSVKSTPKERLAELRQFIKLLQEYLKNFKAPIGLEINYSCPNVGIDPASLINEVGQSLDPASQLGIPLQAKFNAVTPVQTACEACQHPACDALTMSNAIPWGKLPERINYKKLFGSEQSPLAHIGGGGLSGWPLAPIVCDWIRQARAAGFDKPIWACGGIDSTQAVERAYQAGASGVQLGSVATLRPWRMRSIIRYANARFNS